MIIDPARVLPVKMISRVGGDGCADAYPTAVPHVHDTGRQLSLKHDLGDRFAFSGVSSLGLTKMVLPVIKAGAIFRSKRKNGKFRGGFLRPRQRAYETGRWFRWPGRWE
jgi:hypothetical protein